MSAPTRRTALAALVGAGAALSLPTAIRAAGAVIDPTFALIDRHRAAFAGFDAALRRNDGHDVEVESQAEQDALEALLTPEPTTLAGLRALTDYMAAQDERTGDWQTARWALATFEQACRALIPEGGA